MSTVTCRCGKVFANTVQYCPACGTLNKNTVILPSQNTQRVISPTQPMAPTVSLTQPIASTVSPTQPIGPTTSVTPPAVYQNPTIEQILQALISKDNFYAPWGKLLYDDTQKHMWPYASSYYNRSSVYAGSVFQKGVEGISLVQAGAELNRENVIPNDTTTIFGSTEEKPGFWKRLFFGTPSSLPSSVPASPYSQSQQPQPSPLIRNFAFQTQVKFQAGKAGLIFRSDDQNRAYYCFSIDDHEEFSFFAKDSAPLAQEKSGVIKVGRPNLLAAVVQEATIYLYINLQLVATLDDTSLLHEGKVGIMSDAYAVEFSYAKVWVK